MSQIHSGKNVNDLTLDELKAEVYHLTHLLWGHCRESPEYDKTTWGRFSLCLERLKSVASEPSPIRTHPAEPREFVAAWQQAVFLEDVSERLGQPVQSLMTKANRYRKKGVGLKTLVSRYYGADGSGDRTVDWDALETLAKGLNP